LDRGNVEGFVALFTEDALGLRIEFTGESSAQGLSAPFTFSACDGASPAHVMQYYCVRKT
jgi:hypothetical protein